MRKIVRGTALAVIAALAAGCVRQADIALPTGFRESSERIALTGLGGWHNGHFKLGASEGRFARASGQTRDAGIFVTNIGGGRFDLSGPELGQLSGTCGFHESEVDADVVTVTRDRLAYGCEFRRSGVAMPGGLLLAETPRGTGLLAGRTRTGELQIGDLRLGIRAIHHMEGGGLPTGSPLGYAFDIDGRQVGAVDLNGTGRTIYAPREPGPEREAVLIASTALSIFWDPGEND